MPVLKEGSSGPDVAKLQERLKQVGFNPDRTDGTFDAATKAAVIAFQKSERLLADGLAGPRTQGALCLSENPVSLRDSGSNRGRGVADVSSYPSGQYQREPSLCPQRFGRQAIRGRQAYGSHGVGDDSRGNREFSAHQRGQIAVQYLTERTLLLTCTTIGET